MVVIDRKKKRPRQSARSGPVVNMRRGFNMLHAPDKAREIYERLMSERLKHSPPDSILDIYDWLPPTAEFDEPVRPEHLLPVIERLELACDKQVRFVLHTPPRHGKSLLIRVAFIWYHANRPGRRHTYITYNQTKANDAKWDLEFLLRELGIPFRSVDDTVHIEGGYQAGGTTIKFTGVTRSLTGYTISGVAFIDDPISGDDKATSMLQREKVWNFVQKDLMTRKMGDLSIVCVMTRWHNDDLSGRLISRLKWEYVRLPALCDDEARDPLGRQLGEPLWPLVFDIAELDVERRDRGEKTWASMYQGNPITEGERVFRDDFGTYKEIPQHNVTYSIGMDSGYGDSRYADWSVLVRLARDNSTGVTYIDRVIRRQCKFDAFVPDIWRMYEEKPCMITWFWGGTEKGYGDLLTSDLMKKRLPRINMLKATKDKYFRALDTADAWNDHRILVPYNQTAQIHSFVRNVIDFTGNDDPHDDDVDALVGAFEYLKPKSAPKFGRRASPQLSAADRMRAGQSKRWGF